jgi:hypothetical protein
MKREIDSQLDCAFQAYRSAAVVPEASTAFTPGVWQAIEARRSNRVFSLWAKALTSCALAASLTLGVLSSRPPQGIEPEYVTAFLEDSGPAMYDVEFASASLDLDSLR